MSKEVVQTTAVLALPPGFRHLSLGVVGSTNDEAQRFAQAGEPAGLIVSAGEQTKGRGRQRRTWLSPAGGLYCSFLLRPDCPPRRAPELGFVVAVAVAEAVEALVAPDRRVSCKWPNDVLVRGFKIAGILVESAATAADQLDWVIAGIGVNVDQRPDPSDVMYPATCLAEQGAGGVTPEGALAAIAAALADWLGHWQQLGFAAVRQAWLQRGHRRGDRLVVRAGEEEVEGAFLDLDPTGALILESRGRRRTLTAGDCFPVEVLGG